MSHPVEVKMNLKKSDKVKKGTVIVKQNDNKNQDNQNQSQVMKEQSKKDKIDKNSKSKKDESILGKRTEREESKNFEEAEEQNKEEAKDQINPLPNNDQTVQSNTVQDNTQDNIENEEVPQNGQTQITNFFTGGGPQKKVIKAWGMKRHPKSLLKDDSMAMTKVEANSNIFEIIMPWKEKVQTETKKGQSGKKTKKGDDHKKQQSLSSFIKGVPEKQEKQIQSRISDNKQVQEQEEGDENLEKLALVKKVKEVQSIRFDKYAQGVQAILINPKWRVSDKYEPEDKYLLSEKEKNRFQKSDTTTRVNNQHCANENVNMDSQSDDEMEIDDQDIFNQQKSGNMAFQGISMEEFQKLTIPPKLMKDGMLFVWVEKEYIRDVCIFFESQNFYYVENMCWVMLDQDMKKEVENTGFIDVTPAFIRDDYCFLKKSKKTLLMFRRMANADLGNKLELRHQRTGDVVFDWKDKINPFIKPQEYVYQMIETLLPKAKIDPKNPKFKMIELWAQDDKPRKNWLKFIGLNQ